MAQLIVGSKVSPFPLVEYGPTTIVDRLNPRIAGRGVMKALEAHRWGELSPAAQLDGLLGRVAKFVDRKAIREHKDRVGVAPHLAREDKAQHARRERRVKPMGLPDGRIDLRFFDDGGCKVPVREPGERRNHRIAVGLLVLARVKVGEVVALLQESEPEGRERVSKSAPGRKSTRR